MIEYLYFNLSFICLIKVNIHLVTCEMCYLISSTTTAEENRMSDYIIIQLRIHFTRIEDETRTRVADTVTKPQRGAFWCRMRLTNSLRDAALCRLQNIQTIS